MKRGWGMFCKWCGKKIKAGLVICPFCGKEQGTLTEGNGFWDLCDEKLTSREPDIQMEKAPNEAAEIDMNSSRKKEKNKFMILLVSGVFAFAVCIIQIVQLNNHVNDLQEVAMSVALSQKAFDEKICELDTDIETVNSKIISEKEWNIPEKYSKNPQIIIEVLSVGLNENTKVLLEVSGLEKNESEYEYHWQVDYEGNGDWKTIDWEVPYLCIENEEILRYRCFVKDNIKSEEYCAMIPDDSNTISENQAID